MFNNLILKREAESKIAMKTDFIFFTENVASFS